MTIAEPLVPLPAHENVISVITTATKIGPDQAPIGEVLKLIFGPLLD